MLLDAAAFVPTNRLDLSRRTRTSSPVSFYKLFGWPTGVGALIARREALAKLERPWFSGGTIVAAFVQRDWYQSAPGAAHFEDGTVNFLNLPAIEIGLRFLERDRDRRDPRARPGARRAAARGARVAAALGTGRPPRPSTGRATSTGAARTVAFNFLHPDGRIVDERYVDRVARRHSISLRTGCFCNPGAGEVAFTISRETLVGGEFGDGMTLDDYVRAIGLPSGGAIRASLGLASNAADIERFAAFAAEFVDLAEVPGGSAAAQRLLRAGTRAILEPTICSALRARWLDRCAKRAHSVSSCRITHFPGAVTPKTSRSRRTETSRPSSSPSTPGRRSPTRARDRGC